MSRLAYTPGDWSLMAILRLADGSFAEIPRAFIEGDFPKSAFTIVRRKVQWVGDTGYMTIREANEARFANRHTEI